MTKYIPFFIILSLFFTSCAGMPQEQKKAEYRYTVETTHQGSRSEGQIGILLVGKTEINGYFDIVVIGGEQFTFIQNQYLWGFRGYKKEPLEEKPREPAGRLRFTPENRALGWVPAPLAARQDTVPPAWIWVKRDTIEAFVDSAKIEEFIRAFSISPREPLILKKGPVLLKNQ